MRTSSRKRVTGETSVAIDLALDEQGPIEIRTGIGFFDHMLELLAFHAGIGLRVSAEGDLEVDGHHTVEDIGIGLGEALVDALGDKAGIARYAHAIVPLNEALGRAVLDLCGRGHLEYVAGYNREKVGGFAVELAEEFFRSFADSGKLTLHLDLLRGGNVHHGMETLFKATGRALGEAIRPHAWRTDVPSTKGVI